MTIRRWPLIGAGLLTCASASGLLGACASDDSDPLGEPEPGQVTAPVQDAAAGDAEPEPCTSGECLFFPEECSSDTLCPTGPFDPVNPAAGMDWRTRIQIVRGRSANDVWLAGTVGTIARFDGASWTKSETGSEEALSFLWLTATSEIAFGSPNRIYARGLDFDAGGAGASAGGWSLLPRATRPSGFGSQVTAAWAPSGSEQLWLAMENTLWRARVGAASNVEFAAGIPTSVCTTLGCRRMRSIHGASAKTVWAVGESGVAVRIDDADGATPRATAFNTATWTGFSGVWAASDTNVWAVGGLGTIRHYTGDPVRWDAVLDVPTSENLNAVWGTSPSDIWAVGNAGVVLHYDGTSWSRIKIAGLGTRRPDLYTVWSPAAGQVWIGGLGVVLALGGNP